MIQLKVGLISPNNIQRKATIYVNEYPVTSGEIFLAIEEQLKINDHIIIGWKRNEEKDYSNNGNSINVNS